jgi:hypothetical protein
MRDLHAIAETLRSHLGTPRVLNNQDIPVAVDALAEQLGLRIIGSERMGRYKLPPWKKGEIRIARRELIVRANLLNDDNKEVEVLEVIAHELGHLGAHECFAWQRPLPFGQMDARRLQVGRFQFGREQRGDIEREAIFIGALLQVPVNTLKGALLPTVESYCLGPWASLIIGGVEAEFLAAKTYSQRAVETTMATFGVTRNTAKVSLGYWNALIRPPREWIREFQEARQTSLR